MYNPGRTGEYDMFGGIDMGHYNFDEIIDRSNTSSIKHTFHPEQGKTPDVLPLWVADMDFKSPDEVIERLKTVRDELANLLVALGGRKL